MTDRYAVIGNPVAHSLSPRIHARFASMSGEDIVYDAVEAPVGGFADAAERFFAAGGRGLNVTLPFKLDAYRWVDGVDPAANAAGAVNTIVARNGAMRGCNTDGAGLVADLSARGWPLRGASALLLGAGGAVRGALEPLRRAGVAELTIANRTRAKAERLAGDFDAKACGLDEVGDQGWDLVINGTSAGLAGCGALIREDAVAGAHCYDMVYRLDGETPFCAFASANGARAVCDGLGMLVEQAAEAFLLWRGTRPATEGVVESLRG